MTAKIYFIVQTIICLGFGFTLVFMPAYLGEVYLTNTSWRTEASDLLGKGYGSLLITLAFVFWNAKDAKLSSGRRLLLMIPCFSGIFLIIIHTMAILAKVETTAAWGTVAISVYSFVVGGMLLMKEKVTEA